MNIVWIILIFAFAIAGGWLIAYILHQKKIARDMGPKDKMPKTNTFPQEHEDQ